MLCQQCGKNEAMTHIHSIINGVLIAHHVCSSCAAKAGYGNESEKNLEQMLSHIFGNSISEKKKKSTICCPCCGMTFSEISQSGKCGCSDCYTTFYEQLMPYLKKVQGSTEYVGKKIVREKNSESIEELNIQLKELIEKENYEQAAIVRDKIKKLKEGAL